MKSSVLEFIEENENMHVIAYEKHFILAYDKTSKKCQFKTKYFKSDLLGEMPDVFQDWANNLLKKLNYSLSIIETETEYFNIINL